MSVSDPQLKGNIQTHYIYTCVHRNTHIHIYKKISVPVFLFSIPIIFFG